MTPEEERKLQPIAVKLTEAIFKALNESTEIAAILKESEPIGYKLIPVIEILFGAQEIVKPPNENFTRRVRDGVVRPKTFKSADQDFLKKLNITLDE